MDELARQARLPVRTIREYQTLRLLPPPRRRGRIGLYNHDHVERLAVIARLQQRGYSLAAIKDLLEAWNVGTDLSSLLGVDMGTAALDETPLRLTRAELKVRLPALSAAHLRHARTVGLVQPDGTQHVIVRSPALLALVTDAIDAGIPPGQALDLIGVLRDGLGTLAESIADQVVDHVLEPLRAQGRVGGFEPLLRRGRLLLLQGAVSAFADRLGDAFLARAERDPVNGAVLRAAIEAVRVGATIDAAGHIERANST